VTHMLSCDVYWHFDVELKLDHFEGCCVPMSEEIADETPVSTRCFCPISVGDSGSLYD